MRDIEWARRLGVFWISQNFTFWSFGDTKDIYNETCLAKTSLIEEHNPDWEDLYPSLTT